MSYIGGGGVYNIKVILLFHLVTLYSTLVRKPTPTVMCNQNKSDSKPVDKEIRQMPSLKDEIKRISESAEEEAQMELQMLLKQFEDWKKNNTGSFSDFMKDKSDPPVKEIKLANGGSVEDYADLIDAYTKGIDVLEGESLTEYINRIRAAEAKKND